MEKISYNIQHRNKAEGAVHRAREMSDNDELCITHCGRWMDVDKYIVTTKPVTCARCLEVLHRKEEEDEDE